MFFFRSRSRSLSRFRQKSTRHCRNMKVVFPSISTDNFSDFFRTISTNSSRFPKDISRKIIGKVPVGILFPLPATFHVFLQAKVAFPAPSPPVLATSVLWNHRSRVSKLQNYNMEPPNPIKSLCQFYPVPFILSE